MWQGNSEEKREVGSTKRKTYNTNPKDRVVRLFFVKKKKNKDGERDTVGQYLSRYNSDLRR